MKRLLSILFVLCMLFSLCGCVIRDRYINDEPVGQDWHVWGMYDFMHAGDLDIAVLKVYDEEKQHIGYNILLDGDSPGDLIGQIRCEDGKYKPNDFDTDASLTVKDYNKDGKEDLGACMKNGDIMWYTRGEDQYGGAIFTFAEAEKKAD